VLAFALRKQVTHDGWLYQVRSVVPGAVHAIRYLPGDHFLARIHPQQPFELLSVLIARIEPIHLVLPALDSSATLFL